MFGSIGNICVFNAVKRKTKNPSHCRNSSKTHYTVGTVPKPITLSEQFKNQSHCRNSSKTHHTVRKVQKPITLSEQFKNPSHCRNSSKIWLKNRRKGQNRYPLTHKYITAHYPGLERHPNKKWRDSICFRSRSTLIGDRICLCKKQRRLRLGVLLLVVHTLKYITKICLKGMKWKTKIPYCRNTCLTTLVSCRNTCLTTFVSVSMRW